MERAEEDEGGAHMTRKQSPNGRARSLVQQMARHFSLILTSQCLEKKKKKHDRHTAENTTQTHTPNTAPLACCAARSPHRFSSHLYFHLVWASCYWVLPLTQGWSWVCVCVWERSIDLSTAKRIKESEQACPSFCHVINIVSMSLFAALATLPLYDTKHVSAVTKTPWTDSLIGTKLINNQAKNAQHWQVSAF